MIRRSVLFSPGDKPELLYKAAESGADTIVFDLEDAVAPARKQHAREAVSAVLCDPSFVPAPEVCVRVNGTDELETEDIEAITAGDAQVDAVMIPNVESPDDIDRITDLLRDNGCVLPIIALCESAAGVLSAAEIAATDPVSALGFGAEDLTADIGATRTEGDDEVSYARQHVVLAASAAGIDAIDSPCTAITDTDRVADETALARRLGYDGKMAIHPDQVGMINEAFTPDSEDVAWAKKVLAAAEGAEAHDRGVFRVDDEMIDAPLIERAERILERHQVANRSN